MRVGIKDMNEQERRSVFNASLYGLEDGEHQVTALAAMAKQLVYLHPDDRQLLFASMFGIADEGVLADTMKWAASVAERMTEADIEAFLTKALAISGEFEVTGVLEVLATKLQPMSDNQRRRYFNKVLAISDISLRADLIIAIRQAMQTLPSNVRERIASAMPAELHGRRTRDVSSSLPVI
jgi:hypothetical protein